MTEAAFKACYSEWRMIKTRATVQLVFEIPIEQADAAYQALGGMPIAAKEVWCGIARLGKPTDEPVSPERPLRAGDKPGSGNPTIPVPIRAGKEKRPFSELAPSQQAGILCNEEAFWKFLRERDPKQWLRCHYASGQQLEYEVTAAAVVRELCKVDSRSDIKPDNADWSGLVLAYRLWMNHPEYAA